MRNLVVILAVCASSLNVSRCLGQAFPRNREQFITEVLASSYEMDGCLSIIVAPVKFSSQKESVHFVGYNEELFKISRKANGWTFDDYKRAAKDSILSGKAILVDTFGTSNLHFLRRGQCNCQTKPDSQKVVAEYNLLKDDSRTGAEFDCVLMKLFILNIGVANGEGEYHLRRFRDKSKYSDDGSSKR